MSVASIVQVSIKSGGTGLNLVSANHVLITDLWWNQAVEQQVNTHYPLSLSRAHVGWLDSDSDCLISRRPLTGFTVSGRRGKYAWCGL
jgi:hypothetical protein